MAVFPQPHWLVEAVQFLQWGSMVAQQRDLFASLARPELPVPASEGPVAMLLRELETEVPATFRMAAAMVLLAGS